MIAKIQTKIGSTTYGFEIEEKDEFETLHKAIVLGNPPQRCDVCGQTEDFSLSSHKASEGKYTYINVVCGNEECGAKANLGKYQGSGYFWHKFERWVPKETVDKLRPANE